MNLTRRILSGLISVTGLTAMTALADDYAESWGPPVGSELPVLEAPDHSGQPRTLADLTGEKGLLLFLSRSADW